jgi:alpha-glucosidase
MFSNKNYSVKKIILTVLLIVFSSGAFAENSPGVFAAKKVHELSSPNEKVKFSFVYEIQKNGKSDLYYHVTKAEKSVIEKSRFNLVLDNHLSEWALAIKNTPTGAWMENLKLTGMKNHRHDQTWEPVYGERNLIRDNYSAMTLTFEQKDNPVYTMDINIRVYDEGVAFQYHFPDNPTGIYYRIMAENTEFTFPVETYAWFTPWAQALATRMPLKNWPTESERPLTLELKNGTYVALAEANVKDYVRTKFSLANKKKNTVITSMHDPVDIIPGTSTPWRVILIADSAAKLLESNDLLLNLNEPSRIADTDWIKPGKIVRDMSLTEEGAIAWIDFSAKHNLQYLLFDWKWYGSTFTFDSDASKVAIDLDLQKVIDYGKSKGVGIWLYVNQQALLKQDAEIFPIYKNWGVVGVKYGFVQLASHRWTAWLYDSIKRAADNKLMVNIHDEFRFSGEQRTWPHVLTVEGIRGNEEMPDATSNVTLPFTRGIAGMGDYTICYYDKRIKTTHAHQLALSVVMYSPLQTLFWYDKASDYTGEAEIEFFAKVPTVWDDTNILAGEIGQFIVTARKSGTEWYLGAITNNDARSVEVNFDFLEPNKNYVATVYYDDAQSTSKTKVSLRELALSRDTNITFDLQASGGVALWIREATLTQ